MNKTRNTLIILSLMIIFKGEHEAMDGNLSDLTLEFVQMLNNINA